MPRNVLCVVAHPDDEVLGCGGTLAKHAEAGDRVTAVIAASRDLVEEISGASRALGIRPHLWRYPDQQLDTMAFTSLVAIPEESSRDHGPPDVVYTHWPHDLNLDHELTARAVLTAFRPPYFQGTLLAFETLSSTEWGARPFEPNWYESLTPEQVKRKAAALECYQSELRDQPHPRNSEGVWTKARQRGDEICVEYAEAFHLLRRTC